MTQWAPTALLPVFEILGTDYTDCQVFSNIINEEHHYDTFTRISFTYKDAVASIKVGNGIKSEGELIISGTEGYIYVPAPWWKTDYFEVRYEDATKNKRCFYQLDGEGIRYEITVFLKMIENNRIKSYITEEISEHISKLFD